MRCPKCGAPMRPSKKHPGYYLCDTCRKRYPGSAHTTTATSTSHSSANQTQYKRKRKKKRRSKAPLFFFILLLLAIIGIILFKSGIFSAEDTGGKALEPKTTPIATDETGSLNGLELKILSSKTSNGNKRIKPSEGNVFLLIEVEIHNNTNAAVLIQDVANFNAKYKGESVEHSSSAYSVLSSKKKRLNGSIDANGTLTGYVCYEVPDSFDTIDLEFSNPVWYNQKIAFGIKKP